jgi:hypothetical protein
MLLKMQLALPENNNSLSSIRWWKRGRPKSMNHISSADFVRRLNRYGAGLRIREKSEYTLSPWQTGHTAAPIV